MFLETLTPDLVSSEVLGLPKAEIRADIDQIYRMFELERTIRFFGQYHWEAETREAVNNYFKSPEVECRGAYVSSCKFCPASCATLPKP